MKTLLEIINTDSEPDILAAICDNLTTNHKHTVEMNPNSREGYGNITEEQRRLLELTALCKQVPVFEFEGVLFQGNYVEIVKRYVELNPSKKFFIWLQDNVTILEPVANKKKSYR